MRQQPQQ